MKHGFFHPEICAHCDHKGCERCNQKGIIVKRIFKGKAVSILKFDKETGETYEEAI